MAEHKSLPHGPEPPERPSEDGETRVMRVVRGMTREAPANPSFDRIIHERIRLAIVSALSVSENLSFSELKQLLDVTDGNLSVHARKLEEAGYVTASKGFEGRVPKTEYRITALGRRSLQRYLDHMEALIRAMRNASPDGGDT